MVKRFGPDQGLDDMVDELIIYCDKYRYFPELLAEVQQHNPRQYARFFEPALSRDEPTEEEPGLSIGRLGSTANIVLIVGVVIAVLAMGASLLVPAVMVYVPAGEFLMGSSRFSRGGFAAPTAAAAL